MKNELEGMWTEIIGLISNKGNPVTCYVGTEGRRWYSSNPFMTSALEGVGGQHHTPTDLARKYMIPVVQEAGWASGAVWKARKI